MGISWNMDVAVRHNLRSGAETRGWTRGLDWASQPLPIHVRPSIGRAAFLDCQQAASLVSKPTHIVCVASSHGLRAGDVSFKFLIATWGGSCRFNLIFG